MTQAFLYSRALNSVDKDSFLISEATVACVFFGTPNIQTSKASWLQMEWQISRALAAEALSSKHTPTTIFDSVEAEDMFQISSDFCHHSGQMQLLSCYETLMTSTVRGKLFVSQDFL